MIEGKWRTNKYVEKVEFKPVKWNLKYLEKELDEKQLDEADSFLLRVQVCFCFFYAPYSKSERNAQDSYSYFNKPLRLAWWIGW